MSALGFVVFRAAEDIYCRAPDWRAFGQALPAGAVVVRIVRLDGDAATKIDTHELSDAMYDRVRTVHNEAVEVLSH